MAVLKFSMVGIRKIYEHSKSKTEFAPSFAQLSDPQYLKEGKTIPEKGYADYQDIEFTKIPPNFILVKDEGIYIMAGTKAPLFIDAVDRKPGDTSNFIVYADGFDPNKDEDVWERSHDISGDDFGEHLPLEWLEIALEKWPDKKWLRIKLKEDQVELEKAA